MRLFSKYTISCLALAGAAFLPSATFAADLNTYRAGQAYLKTGAANYTQCEQQCQGDAACRGWNFIRPNPRSASGICEFNARLAPPTQSPISVSGVINTNIDPLMSRAIPAGTNTVRVGTPSTAKRAAAPQRQRPTIVRRKPVPNTRQAVRPATHARPQLAKPVQAQPNKLQPRIYGGAPAQARAPQARTQQRPLPQQRQQAQPKQASLTPEQAYYRKQYLAQKRAQEQALRSGQRQAPTRPLAQQGYAPQQRPMPAGAPQTSRQMIPARAPQQQRSQIPQAARPQAQMQAPQAPQAQQRPAPLYGSLHDDLTANMTEVPRPKTAPDNAANPDAPLATSRAVPTAIIEVTPLPSPALPSLAGG